MTRVLIVDDDPRMSAALAGELVRQGYETQTADSVDAALELLLNAPVDVLVTDLRMSGRDGLDLIRMARATSPKTRAVLMSAYATAKDYKVAIELGAVDVLTKPFTPEDLEEAIKKALDSQTGVQGLVHGLSLVDVLQMFHFARRSLAIHVGGEGATIHLRDGEVVHAVSGEFSGEVALRTILESQVGSVRTSPAVSVPITITRSFQALLLDLVRAIDEAGRSLPPPRGTSPTGKTPTPDLVFDLGVEERTTVDHTPRVYAPDPSEVAPTLTPPAVEDANLAATLEPDPAPKVEVDVRPGRGRLWAALAALSLLAVGAWWGMRPAPDKPATAPEAKRLEPPTPTPPPTEAERVELNSEPAGLTIVDVESGEVLGQTPLAIRLGAAGTRRVAAIVDQTRSPAVELKASDPRPRLELKEWVASLAPVIAAPPASRPPPRAARTRTKAPPPPPPSPMIVPPAPPVEEPPAPPPVAERPKLPPLEPKKPSLGVVDDERPSIGTVDDDQPELAPLD